MYHGLLYDRTGRVVEIPGQDRIPDTIQVRTYPVVERHSWVWVWMGNAPADEDLIPPVMGMDHPDYVFSHGQVDYAAEAHLVNDNALDLSHVSFVHAESFRMSETWARQRPTVTERERSIRSERWIRSEGPLGTVNAEKLVDTYFCYDFFVPGVLLMIHRTHPVGTADALHGQPPDLNQEPEVFISQAVTPQTAKTTRYFYIVGSRRGGDETAVDMATMEKAFSEDRTIIEAQQRNIDITPGWRFTPTTADRGIALFNRIVQRLAREEFQSIEASLPVEPDSHK